MTETRGRDLDARHIVTDGKIDGNKLVLDMEARENPVHLDLTLNGDELAGEAIRARGGGLKNDGKSSDKAYQRRYVRLRYLGVSDHVKT